MSLIDFEGVGVTRDGAPLLEAVTFGLEPGQRLGVIGTAGAGKSLLALTLAGLLPPGAVVSGGRRFEGVPMPTDEAALARLRRDKIGVLLQHAGDGLDRARTVGAQLSAAALATLSGLGVDAAVAGRLPPMLDAETAQLVAVAAVLARRRALLIADDPTARLGMVAQRRVLELIERQCREHGMTLVLVSDDLKAVALLCTRVVVMAEGRIVEAGDKEAVFGHPRHAVTRRLLTAGRHRDRTLARAPIGATLLEVRHVSRQFGVRPWARRGHGAVLTDVNFTLRAGESLAIVGPPGAGKSVLLRIIAGLERASAGELEFERTVYRGRDLPAALRRAIGFVFADPATSFDPRLSIAESIAEPLRLEGRRTMEEMGAFIDEVLRAVGLAPGVLGAFPAQLPLALLQRLALARALVARPRFVVLDDPAAALDIATRGELLVLLNRLRADFGLTFVVATRDLEIARLVADRALVLAGGRVVETGTPLQLLDRPQHAATRELVDATLPDVGIVPVF